MNKPKHKAVKELSDIVKAQKKEELNVQDRIKSNKSLQIKIGVVDTLLRGPKHKKRERAAIFDPKTAELLTDENEILSATLQYNVGVLTKNKVVEKDQKEVDEKVALHEDIMSRQTKGDKLSLDTWKAVLKVSLLILQGVFWEVRKTISFTFGPVALNIDFCSQVCLNGEIIEFKEKMSAELSLYFLIALISKGRIQNDCGIFHLGIPAPHPPCPNTSRGK